jgi:MoaA/NifB/PqqE/SkfB family radical SAM enzyme
MAEDVCEVSVPWRIDEDAEIVLKVRDRSLLGSGHSFLRLDIYPTTTPSHPQRHHGYWDIPMDEVQNETTAFSFKNGNVWLKRPVSTVSFPPTWRGTLPLAGPCTITFSMLDITSYPSQTIFTKSSNHFLSGEEDFPFDRVSLYLTRRCNLQCDRCWRESFQTRDLIDTPPKVIDAVVEAVPQFQSVLLHGDGEPLMHPNLPEILTRIKKRLPSTGGVGIPTNGMLMDSRTVGDLVDRGVNWLEISMDGATKSTMERIRRGCHFETVVENLSHAVEYGKKTRRGEVLFSIHFTYRPGENVHEIPALMRLACSLGIDNVTVEPLRDYDTGEFLVCSAEVLEPLYREAKGIGTEHGVTLTVKRLRPYQSPCCEFVEDVRVNVSGAVSMCSFRKLGEAETPAHVLGNVTETPLLDICNSDSVRELRRRIVAGDFPAECALCEHKFWGCNIPY